MDSLLDEGAKFPQAPVEEIPDQKRSPKALPDEDLPKVDASIPPLASVPESPNPVKKIPDLRGKKKAMTDRLYASLGLSRPYVPRITRRRTAIYQLVNYKNRLDKRLQGPDQHVDPPVWSLSPVYTITDNHEPDLMKREKTLTFYEGGSETVYIKDPVTNKSVPQAIPKVGDPVFNNGQIVVNIYNQYPQYAWFELHPRNASNKFRNQTLPPIFERVDTKFESPHIQSVRLDLQREAEGYVIDLKPDKLMNLASRLTNPTINPNMPPQELRLALRMRAKANPEEVLYMNPDNVTSVKIATIHALDFGVIQYVPENEAYYMDEDNEPVFTVPAGNKPFDALIIFLYSDPEGKKVFEEIKEELSFWF